MIPLGNRHVALKRYYRSIRNCLPSSRKLKAKVLAEIENNINEYLRENPSADIASIEARFGAPEQIAASYVGELETPELLSIYVSKRQKGDRFFTKNRIDLQKKFPRRNLGNLED